MKLQEALKNNFKIILWKADNQDKKKAEELKKKYNNVEFVFIPDGIDLILCGNEFANKLWGFDKEKTKIFLNGYEQRKDQLKQEYLQQLEQLHQEQEESQALYNECKANEKN